MGTKDREVDSQEIREVQGECRFCHQIRMIRRTEDEWLDLIRKNNVGGKDVADWFAALECSCREGADFREEQRVFREAEENINIMFGEEYPEIADTFQRLKESIWHNQLKRVKISTHENETAEIFRTQNRIRITLTKKAQSELVTSG